MALIIDLKPGEKLLIGEAVIINDNQRTRLHISGKTPIMREKDVLKEDDADTPCKKIYFVIQCMYLSATPEIYHEQYFRIVDEIQDAAPTTSVFFMNINDKIIEGAYYKALKEARDLVAHEAELMGKAMSSDGNTIFETKDE